MKIFEVTSSKKLPAKKLSKAEAKKKASATVRYNSEVGTLFGMIGKGKFNPNHPERSIPESILTNPSKTYADIKKYLLPVFNEDMFLRWAVRGKEVIPMIVAKQGSSPTRFGWVGGENIAGGVTDIQFESGPTAGISIKDTTGITLANLTPKVLGIEPPHKIDTFSHSAKDQYDEMKKNIFTDVMNLARSQPDVPLAAKDPRYSVTYESKTKKYRCVGKASGPIEDITATKVEILSSIETNSAWQRPFGDWFQANWATKKAYAAPLFSSIVKGYEQKIEKTLSSSAGIASILRFEKKPYYYLAPKHFYYIPSAKDVDYLVSKGVAYGNPDGTSQKFIAKIGPPDSDNAAKILIYIRYANGMFASNPTVRVQELKDPQYIAWEKLD
jgi:hypothetical protein